MDNGFKDFCSKEKMRKEVVNGRRQRDKTGILLTVEIGGLTVRRYVEGNNTIEREILMMKEKRIDGAMSFMR